MISQVGLRRKLLSIALITLAVICPSLARAQATGVSPQNAKYDHGLRHFYWLYLYDAPGHQRRDWYQESSVTWNEIYEDGRYNHSRIVDAHASVDGNTGVIAVGDTATLRLFIPDQDAHGSHSQWLRIQHPGATSWNYLAQLTEVRGSAAQTTTHTSTASGTQAPPSSSSLETSIDWIVTTINNEPPQRTVATMTQGNVQALSEDSSSVTIPVHEGCILTVRTKFTAHAHTTTSQETLDGATELVWRVDLSKMQPASTQVKPRTLQIKNAVCSGDCTMSVLSLHSSGYDVTPLSCTQKKGDDVTDCLDKTKARKSSAFAFHDENRANTVAQSFRNVIKSCGGQDAPAAPQ